MIKHEPQKFCISGAGPIGLTLALGLGQSGFSVKIIDQKASIDISVLESDRRMLALSHRTVEFFKKLGVWQTIAPHATIIDAVNVSQKESCVEVMLKAKKLKMNYLGYLVPQGRLILALYEKIQSCEQVELILNSQIISTETNANDIAVNIQSTETYVEVFNWLVSAEGVDSALRNRFGIESFVRDYDQVAVIARAEFDKPHHNVAYERFTTEGPLALLPVNEKEMAVVLVAKRSEYEKWLRASDLTYSLEVLKRFGAKLGEINWISERQVWPLTLMVPQKVVDGRLFLVGNSAHGLHPIAGQGLNLGIRDCEQLMTLFICNSNPSQTKIKEFNEQRHKDIVKTVGATDFLVNAFAVEGFMAQKARTIGLLGVKYLPFVKGKIAQFGMGY